MSDDNIESLYFSFDDVMQFELPPSDFLFDGTYIGMPLSCVVAVYGWTQDSNLVILGDNFLKNYYQVYDYTKN